MSNVHWLALASVAGFGTAAVRKLIQRYGDVEFIFQAPASELAEIPRVTETMAEQLGRVSLDELEQELYALAEQEIELLTWEDARFPSHLRELPDAPLILFMRGRLVQDDRFAVAIVGTRSPTSEANHLALRLGREFALHGLTVVSGLALGIDTAAHQGALEAEEGRTLAVLGSGLRVIHPRENAELAERITAHGALLSELMPNTPPRGPTLMARDRIVSGLAHAVIVVEAGQKSGSLDTAERARKQSRLLYAVPGSSGTDGLIRGGAIPLEPDEHDLNQLAETIRRHTSSRAKSLSDQPKLL